MLGQSLNPGHLEGFVLGVEKVWSNECSPLDDLLSADSEGESPGAKMDYITIEQSMHSESVIRMD